MKRNFNDGSNASRHFIFYLLFLPLTNECRRKGQVNIECEEKRNCLHACATSISICMNSLVQRQYQMSLCALLVKQMSIYRQKTVLSVSIDSIKKKSFLIKERMNYLLSTICSTTDNRINLLV